MKYTAKDLIEDVEFEEKKIEIVSLDGTIWKETFFGLIRDLQSLKRNCAPEYNKAVNDCANYLKKRLR